MNKRNVGWAWYSNGKRAYYRLNGELKGSDGKTFQALSPIWAQDKDVVYSTGKKLKDADRATFQA